MSVAKFVMSSGTTMVRMMGNGCRRSGIRYTTTGNDRAPPAAFRATGGNLAETPDSNSINAESESVCFLKEIMVRMRANRRSIVSRTCDGRVRAPPPLTFRGVGTLSS